MQQDDGRLPLPGIEIVDADPVDIGERHGLNVTEGGARSGRAPFGGRPGRPHAVAAAR